MDASTVGTRFSGGEFRFRNEKHATIGAGHFWADRIKRCRPRVKAGEFEFRSLAGRSADTFGFCPISSRTHHNEFPEPEPAYALLASGEIEHNDLWRICVVTAAAFCPVRYWKYLGVLLFGQEDIGTEGSSVGLCFVDRVISSHLVFPKCSRLHGLAALHASGYMVLA